MVRSIVIIALAIVCGAAAAIGVNQALRRQPVAAEAPKPKTEPVVVAARRIARGEKLTKDMLKAVPWPAELVPGEDQQQGMVSVSEESIVIHSVDEAVGRVAMTTIMRNEPLFNGKLTKENGEGFIASIIKPGMRAYTIQTKGPSSSVADFVRPQDRVDVLVTIRGTTNDETGGGSTTTLLQSVEILAIDQILDPDADTMKMLERWAKGDNLTSVTLEVTPVQASMLALGQSYGELSLSLRRFGDEQNVATVPATIRDIRLLTPGGESPSGEAGPEPSLGGLPRHEEPPVTYIRTLRGNQSGRVDLATRP